MIDQFIAQTVTEGVRVRILAKNNQKKEKAERNKENAKKHKKRSSNGRFGNR